MTNPTETNAVPNHHAHHTKFAGPPGVVAALSMTVGRTADAAVAIKLAQLGEADRVIDIGCGPGTAVRRAARAGAQVTGVDPAGVMLRVARLLSHNGRMSYIEGAAEALPLPDSSATVAWSLSAVHHWPELDKGLAEVRRVLKSGGRFVVVEHRASPGATGHASHGWTDDQAEAFAVTCRAAGFTGVRVTYPGGGRRPPVAIFSLKP